MPKYKSKYWTDREANEMVEAMEEAEKCAKKIASIYAKSANYVNDSIKRIYNRYQMKYDISEQEARDLINSAESRNMDDLIRELKNRSGDERKELLKEIEAPAYQARIRRLEEVKGNVDRLMGSVYTDEKKLTAETLKDVYSSNYYRTIYDTQQKTGLGFAFDNLDPKLVNRKLRQKWLGGNYSGRIWNNTQELADTLKEEMMVGLLTGKTEHEMAEVINRRFASGASNARRLVRTESAHFYNEANAQAYKECGAEKYRFVATLDLRTSEICQELDGQVFKLEDKEVGVNYPPMHPWCRSTTVMELDEKAMKELTRKALDPESGKTIRVPADMTYKKWYKKYAEGKEIKEPVTIDLTFQQYERYRNLGVGPETYEEFKDIKFNNPEEYDKMKLAYKDKSLQKKIREEYNLTINPEKHARHMKDSEGYIEGRSYMTISAEEVQKLVNEHAGHGEIYRYRSGKFGKKELIILDRNVGVNIDPKTGTETATNRVYIHYSKTGTHAVPTLKGVDKDA